MRLFDCSCHFLPFLPFFFVAAAAAAAGGCLSGDAIYGIDDQVSRYVEDMAVLRVRFDITARKRQISILPK